MKRTFCLFSFLICAFCFAQEKVNADEIIYVKIQTLEEVIYTTKLQEYFYSNDKSKSEFAKETVTQLWKTMLENCDELISRFPNSEYLFETLYKKASLEESLGNVKRAKETYERVLSFETSRTALKNKSLRALAYLSIEEKNMKKL
jgi:outer membrane protein assembly factor BamD (BamD/ComL family)